ncbi:hypothetical protein C1H76_3109 [Elsinoe australis]|uniref:Uncharacterized protein n=1 Tax=Elsinoe australis TaxID=40998 RepID=A0A4V6DXC5_9PEZI|nr:hypothetical protein C1H76_3109 [Elsinoe australis]
MRTFLLTSSLAALALAAPRPQDIEIDAVEAQGLGVADGPPLAAAATAEIPTYDADAAAASAAAEITAVAKRRRQASTVSPITTAITTTTTTIATTTASLTTTTTATTTSKDPSACTPLPKGSGPVSTPDEAKTFLSDPQYDAISNTADTPQGYSLAFSSLHGATEGNGYLGYYTLKTYNTIQCQQYCDKTDGCQGFDVYLERDPTVNPAPACKNPASTTTIKCSLWGLQVSATTATNQGQWRYDFNVVITASNGYNSLAAPTPIDGYTGPTKLGGDTQAPLLNGKDTYMGYKYYSGIYNPSQCTAACSAQNIYNQKHPRSDGTWDKCIFTNSYVLSKNNVPQGTYCSLYSNQWTKAVATNYGQYRGSDYYSVSQSYGWALN